MKRIYLSLVFLVISLNLSAQSQWINITNQYITNPSFDGNSNAGWTLETSCSSTSINYEAQEFWNGTWNIHQTISVPNGKYRLSVQAFHRPGSNSNSAVDNYASTESDSRLYANDASVALVSVYSQSMDTNYNGGCWGYTTGGQESPWGMWGGTVSAWYPNNMETGAYCFAEGKYQNQLEVEVADGSLTFGIKNTTNVDANWCMMDNWKLEYYGEEVQLTAISLPTNIEVALGETKQLTPTYTPSNATYQTVTWTSSDEKVATVDARGNVTGKAKGDAIITATATDGSGISAKCKVTVTFNGATSTSVEFNEIMAANIDQFIDPTWNYGGWVELYNPTDAEVNIGGYYLSDDPEDLMMACIPLSVGSIPAKGFRTLWFDHKETAKDVGENWENTNIDMKLDQKGGTLYLSNQAGEQVLALTYPAAIMRCSYARQNNTGDWLWTYLPTPSATNSTSSFPANQTQLAAPEPDQPGQVFDGSLTVNVNVPIGMKMAYTTNGSAPTLENSHVVVNTYSTKDLTKKFSVKESTVYRFRMYAKSNDQLPSNVVTRSYIKREKDYYLPVVSLVTDSLGLYGDSIGIYVSGKNGKTANQDGTKRNFNMDWERAASFEYISNGETPVRNEDGYFAQECDIAINGGWSRKYTPRSFKLKAAKQYSLQNSFDYPFFHDKPYIRSKSLLLRNGGNDEYNQTRLKDAALQEVTRLSEFPLNLQSYKPCHVFINGKYLGMLNLREPSNKNYAYANYGYDTDEVDAFEMSVDSGYVQKAGTREAFEQWYSLAEQASDPLAYEQLCNLVDIDDYTNYMAYKFFLNDWDWPHNNAKGFRSQKEGKFHMVVYDLDNCVDRSGNNIFNDFASKQWHTFYSRPEYNWTSLTKEVELVTIFLNMLQNEDFKKQFIDTYCLVGGTVFSDEDLITETVNNMAAKIQTALSWEGHTPYGSGRSFAGGIINALTGSFRSNMMTMIKNYSKFNLSSKETQQAELSSNVEGAQMLLNGINIPKGKFSGWLFAPVSITAKAPAGYRFAGWYSDNATTQTTTLVPEASNWQYYESGSLDAEDWTSIDYDASSWSEGQAPFGYGNAGKMMANATTKFEKSDASGNRIPTYYIRKTFTLADAPKDNETYKLDYSVDDGMIAYVNGTEVGLYHMWSGATYEQTCQSQGQNWYEGDTPYSGTIGLDNSILQKGKNVIAFEVHNCNDTSSDIWIEASLSKSAPTGEGGSYVSTNSTYTLPASGDINVMAMYEELTEAEMTKENMTPVRINEVCANNVAAVNDYYKKDDWVELYNTTDEDIELAGMYLTDKSDKPHKYQIPIGITAADGTSATLLAAHGFKVIWCSGRDQQGTDIHANFKLNNEDGKLIRIEAADGSWSDSIFYCRQADGQSVGRYADGASQVFLMQPSIAATNVINSYAKLWEYVPEPDPTGIADQRSSTSYLKAVVGYYSLGGISLGMNPAKLPAGIYIVKYADGTSRKIRK